MVRLALILACLLCATPAAAHNLRVFATVVGDRVEGYGFFVGGGRPSGVSWSARMGDEPIASGTTDGEGRFAFDVTGAVNAPVTVTIDAGDGHAARATLAPDRFAGAAPTSPPADVPDTARDAVTPPPDAVAPPGEPAIGAEDIAAMVEVAVARQVAPLLDRIEQLDARLRVTDLLSGLFFIIGLAGMALWALGRRR